VPNRGDVYLARLDPTEGSEESGGRPVIVVSRDAIRQNSPVVIVVPVTDFNNKKCIYPSHVVLKAGDGGLTKDSIASAKQVRAISTCRFIKQMGHLTPASITQVGAALKIALRRPMRIFRAHLPEDLAEHAEPRFGVAGREVVAANHAPDFFLCRGLVTQLHVAAQA